MCQVRLLKLHEKLKKDPDFLEQYNDIFEEQKRLGIIETVSEPGKKGETHYLSVFVFKLYLMSIQHTHLVHIFLTRKVLI